MCIRDRKKRIPEEAKEQTLLMKPEEERSVDDICIRTLRSTDEGVAFLVSAEGKTIYHAGDLNDWYWKEESEDWNQEMSANFRKYIEPLRDREDVYKRQLFDLSCNNIH